MGDVKTKINKGKDEKLIFLKSDFLRNNLQFSVFNLQVFFEKNNLTYAIYRNHFKRKKNLLRAVRTKILNAAVSEIFFLKSESFRSNLSGL